MTRYDCRLRIRKHLVELNKELLIDAYKEYFDRFKSKDKPRLGEKCLRVADLLRSYLGYSRKTNDVDMVWSLFRLAEDMKVIKHEK